MPSHLSSAAVESVCRSDGMPVSQLDWRANRLADAVAKSAVGQCHSALAAVKCINSAAAVHRHEAAILGAVTRAANTHRVPVVTESGLVTIVAMRDSISAQAAVRSAQQVVPRPVTTSVPVASAELPDVPKSQQSGIRCLWATRTKCSAADILLRDKRRRLASLAKTVQKARSERVAADIVNRSFAMRAEAAGEATPLLRPTLAISSDGPMSAAFIAAVKRVHESSTSSSTPEERRIALRQRIAAKSVGTSRRCEAPL